MRIFHIAWQSVLALLAVAISLIGYAGWKELCHEEVTTNLLRQEGKPAIETCVLHGHKLQIDRVHFSYGLSFRGPNEAELFPHSNKWVGGGCFGGGPRYALVQFCRECRKAEKEWRENQSRIASNPADDQ